MRWYGPYGGRHDVAAICETAPRSDDERVLLRARSEERVLLTEDKDFGRLFHAAQAATPGVLLLRFRAHERADVARVVVDLVARRGADLVGRFVVVTARCIRLGPKGRA